MTLKDQYTITQYLLGKVTLEGSNASNIEGYAYLQFFNADGDQLGSDRVNLELTAGEKSAIANRIGVRIQKLEDDTSWTKLVDNEGD